VSALRWILVPVVAIASIFAAILSMSVVENIYWSIADPCPRAEYLLNNGACILPDGYMSIITSIGSGIAAIYIVVICTFIAPRYKVRVAIAIVAIGIAPAMFLGFLLNDDAPAASAILSGAIAALVMAKVYGSN
jgi:hypothetical protein